MGQAVFIILAQLKPVQTYQRGFFHRNYDLEALKIHILKIWHCFVYFQVLITKFFAHIS